MCVAEPLARAGCNTRRESRIRMKRCQPFSTTTFSSVQFSKFGLDFIGYYFLSSMIVFKLQSLFRVRLLAQAACAVGCPWTKHGVVLGCGSDAFDAFGPNFEYSCPGTA